MTTDPLSFVLISILYCLTVQKSISVRIISKLHGIKTRTVWHGVILWDGSNLRTEYVRLCRKKESQSSHSLPPAQPTGRRISAASVHSAEAPNESSVEIGCGLLVWGFKGRMLPLSGRFRGNRRCHGTRFCCAKSSVLYLLRPLAAERGCHSGAPQNRRSSDDMTDSCRKQ